MRLLAAAPFVLCLWFVPAAVVPAPMELPDTPLAPLLTNLGTLHYAITTTSPRAADVLRPGAAAGLRLQPRRGRALVQGGAAARSSMRHVLLGRGLRARAERQRSDHARTREGGARRPAEGTGACRAGVTDAEQGLIDALAPRYSAEPDGDRAPRDAAFTAAMKALAARFPHDPEINTMYAAAAMEARPWRYWKEADVPEPEIADALATLERMHAGASGSPRRAPLLHPPRRGDQHARPRRAERRQAREPHAGRRTSRPHARAHLHAGRPVRGRVGEQRAGNRRRRGLPRAVPGAGPLPGRLLPAQHPLPLGSRDDGRTKRGGARCRPEGGRQAESRPCCTTRWRCRISRACPTTRSSASAAGRRC